MRARYVEPKAQPAAKVRILLTSPSMPRIRRVKQPTMRIRAIRRSAVNLILVVPFFNFAGKYYGDLCQTVSLGR